MTLKKTTKKNTGALKKSSAVKKNVKTKPLKKIQKKKSLEKEVALSPIMAISDAKMLFDQLSEYIKSKTPVLLVASEVEMVDTAVLQLLTAFAQEMRAKKITINWKNPSKELLNRAEYLGLTNALMLNDHLA